MFSSWMFNYTLWKSKFSSGKKKCKACVFVVYGNTIHHMLCGGEKFADFLKLMGEKGELL